MFDSERTMNRTLIGKRKIKRRTEWRTIIPESYLNREESEKENRIVPDSEKENREESVVKEACRREGLWRGID